MRSNLSTRTINTPNKGSRNGVRPIFIVLHHMATTGFQGVLNSWATGSKEGSAHYAIGNNGEIVSVVPEEFRAWSLSSESFDSQALTFEIANSAVGGSWPVSDAATAATARVVADLCNRYGIPADRAHIIGHREVYSRYGKGYETKCPGGLDLDRVVSMASAVIGGHPSAPSAPASSPVANDPSWAFNTPDTYTQGRVQRALAARGRYSGPVDGEWGPNTIRGIQTTIKNVGYSGPVDGVPGPTTCRLVQVYAQKFGDYTGPIDSVLGVNGWAGFALGLELP